MLLPKQQTAQPSGITVNTDCATRALIYFKVDKSRTFCSLCFDVHAQNVTGNG
jgi:hypothetical protein